MNTANTTPYMLLGTAAVFLPMLLYVLSLLLRTRRIRTKLDRIGAQSSRTQNAFSASESKNEA
ncbi:MAG: hypothetical protein JXA25_11260 [Anaerolineales bacterium]|nr:hypothetical protein [Anaerolineales bacterium]